MITLPSIHLPICLVICKSEMYKVKLNLTLCPRNFHCEQPNYLAFHMSMVFSHVT